MSFFTYALLCFLVLRFLSAPLCAKSLWPQQTARMTEVSAVSAFSTDLLLVFTQKYSFLLSHIPHRFMKIEVFLHHAVRVL